MEQFLFSSPIEFTQSGDTPGVLSGYAMKFNIQSRDRGGYRAIFKPNAFTNLKTNENDLDIKAYRDHDETIYLGRTSNGSLVLKADSVGVSFQLILPDTQAGRDTAVLARDDHFGGMSFGYLPDVYSWKKDEDGTPLQVHSAGRMREISVVFDPSFPNTELQLHALGDPDPAVIAELKQWLGTPRLNSARRRLKLAEFEM